MSASSGVHESRPLKSNSSNNLPCLCLTVSLGVWESWDLSAPSSQLLTLGGFRHRECSYHSWPLEFSSGGFVGRQYCSKPLQLLSFCLSLTQCMCSVQSGLEARSHPESHRTCTITLICSPTYALPVFTGTIWEEKGSMVSTF